MVDLKLVHEYTKNLHILYVEDNLELRESTLKVLNNFFKEVDVAVDGQEGLDIYKTFLNTNTKAYDLVISDINMPHLNGIEMSQKILEIDTNQSIVFITAHNEPEYLHNAIKLGISSFILKPINLQDLATVLLKVCRIIEDRKIVQEHYAMMEELNAQLSNQNDALLAKNKEQERLLRLVNTMDRKSHKITKEPIPQDSTQTDEKENSYYEQIQQLVDEDLSELQELHEGLDASIITIISTEDALRQQTFIEDIPQRFARYASILGMYSSFEELSLAIANLTKAMTEYPQPKDKGNIEDIFLFLEAFMFILGKWQKDLQSETSDNVQHLDVAIIGDLETITNLWLAEKAGEAVEFF